MREFQQVQIERDQLRRENDELRRQLSIRDHNAVFNYDLTAPVPPPNFDVPPPPPVRMVPRSTGR
jgi:hypothetical protein